MSKKEEFMTTLATDEFADDNDDGISLTVYIIHIFIMSPPYGGGA